MAELRMTADAETATPAAGAKRTVAAAEKKGLAIQDSTFWQRCFWPPVPC